MQVVLLNFFLYAEDPVAHSETESRIPILGNVFSMIVTNYPANLYSALKVGLDGLGGEGNVGGVGRLGWSVGSHGVLWGLSCPYRPFGLQ